MYNNNDVSFARSQITVASREEMEGNKSEMAPIVASENSDALSADDLTFYFLLQLST